MASRHAADPPHHAARRVVTACVVVLFVAGVIAAATLFGGRLLVGAGFGRPSAGSAPGASSAASMDGDGMAGLARIPGMPDSPIRPSDPTDLMTLAAPGASTPAPPAARSADRAGLTTADRTAGLLKANVPQRGTGRLIVIPGSSPAPGHGPVKRVRVEVEGGLPVNGAAFADFVLSTLNDPRGWGHGGRMSFARSSGAYDMRVVLASPVTSARLCAPLQTMGTLSCGQGRSAVLTHFRWVKATPDFGSDRTGYRRYVVNHEVGHLLGYGHELCPGAGKVAPVMMQQTKGLKGCLPNSWPYP
jgi:hypothetical protein